MSEHAGLNALPESAPIVAIAGATGFIGRALGRALAPRCRLIGLSRGGTGSGPFAGPTGELRACDLFNLRDAERALDGATHGYYLVHSMMPSARLTQARFEDLDLICADNFARAARRAGLRQIVYLGGLTPAGDALSPHLRSRREVEGTLAAYGVPVTTLRAGLVIGAGGSSFEMMQRLVRRLPAMLCPRWTVTRTQPIALDDVVALLAFALDRAACFSRTFDVGAPEVTTYRQMMAELASLIGARRPLVKVPFLSPRLSSLWVSLIAGAPRALVAPLVRSLEHEMVARDRRLAEMAGLDEMSIREAMQRALEETARREAKSGSGAKPKAFVGAEKKRGGRSEPKVQSVQRMELPVGRDAAWAAAEYLRWLPVSLRRLVRVTTDGSVARFFLALLGTELLVLSHAPDRSGPDRQLFFVTGGALARTDSRPARFELRQIPGGRILLTAIHDYRPRLPWLVYSLTQALFHKLVMALFRRHLHRLPSPTEPARANAIN